MNKKEFFEKIGAIVKNDPGNNRIQKIQRAYWLAKTVHKGQLRDGGDRYFEHCRRTALLFIEHINFIKKESGNLDRFMIVANRNFNSYSFEQIIMMALLHDCIEDCYMPEGLLENECFDFVSVKELSKVRPIYDPLTGSVTDKIRKTDNEYYAEIDCSVFARYVKILDRLDNLRSMQVWPKERQLKYVAETEKYILPIAKKTDETLFKKLLVEIEKNKKEEKQNV